MRRARRIEQRYRPGWWDSMLVGAAQMQDCGLLERTDSKWPLKKNPGAPAGILGLIGG